MMDHYDIEEEREKKREKKKTPRQQKQAYTNSAKRLTLCRVFMPRCPADGWCLIQQVVEVAQLTRPCVQQKGAWAHPSIGARLYYKPDSPDNLPGNKATVCDAFATGKASNRWQPWATPLAPRASSCQPGLQLGAGPAPSVSAPS
jgi:hypothetical protein